VLDVTALILEDHATMRRQFALLDDAHDDPRALAAVWRGLARMLDVHAACEEEVFYPRLLKVGDDDAAEDETDDAVRDHNAIRDAVRAAEGLEIGTGEWWAAVKKAREENDDHLAEEEHDALPDFRRNAPDELRARLAVEWLEWRYAHDSGEGVDTGDKDPESYIAEHS
jgi:Hemerythrin HHE cation binding domain